jgi:hypothetical protein
VAFEPESQNYALINQNIFLIGYGDRIACLAVAMSDSEGMDYIYLSRFRAGESLHNFGAALDWQQRPFTPSFQQGSLSFSLDKFLEFQPEHETYSFPAGSTWMVYTDQVPHAALSGIHQLEQTFYVPVSSLRHEASAPLRVLEGLMGRPLA